MGWKMLQAKIGSRSVRLYQIREGIFSAGMAFSLSHETETLYPANGTEYFTGNRWWPFPNCLCYAAVMAAGSGPTSPTEPALRQ
jgi:hypothetical protein